MATRWFLGVDALRGDSTVVGHEGEIDINSWSWSISSDPSAVSGPARGRPIVHDLVFTAAAGRATLPLINTCNLGRVITSALLSGVNGTKEPFTFLQYDLTRVSISAMTQSTQLNGALVDQFLMHFRGLVGTHWPQNPDGTAGEPSRIQIGDPTR